MTAAGVADHAGKVIGAFGLGVGLMRSDHDAAGADCGGHRWKRRGHHTSRPARRTMNAISRGEPGGKFMINRVGDPIRPKSGMTAAAMYSRNASGTVARVNVRFEFATAAAGFRLERESRQANVGRHAPAAIAQPRGASRLLRGWRSAWSRKHARLTDVGAPVRFPLSTTHHA